MSVELVSRGDRRPGSRCDFHQLVDGRIARTWHLEDHFGIAQQIGLSLS